MMSEQKSKLPDMKELGDMAGKLFKDVKESISQIITNYKHKRTPSATHHKKPTTAKAAPKASHEPKEKDKEHK